METNIQEHLYYLQNLYSQAITKFKQQQNQQAINLFQSILQDSNINQVPFHSVRYSTVISLGQATTNASPKIALECFQKALALLRAEVQGPLIGEDKDQEQFKILIKMYLISEKLGKYERQIELMKMALLKCPQQYKAGLQKRLRSRLEAIGQYFPELDLQQANKENENTKEIKEEESIYIIPRLKIRINLADSLPEYKYFSAWQLILALGYVLLKFKKERGFQEKNYLSQIVNTQEWKELQKKFDLNRTQIEFIFYQQYQESCLEHIISSEEPELNLGKVVKKAAQLILNQKHKFLVQQFKKYQSNLRYPTLSDYFNEIFLLKNFDTSLITHLSVFDESFIQKMASVLPSISSKMDFEVNKESEEYYNFNKLRASLFNIKLQSQRFIRQNRILKQKINILSQGTLISFSNCLILVQKMTGILINQAVLSCSQELLLNDFTLRLFLTKAIAFVLKQKDTTFDQLTSLIEDCERSEIIEVNLKVKGLFLELINIRIQELSVKVPKDQIFALHQNRKIIVLIDFVRKKLLNSMQEIENCVQTLKKQELKQYGFLLFQKLRFLCLEGAKSKHIDEVKLKIVKFQSFNTENTKIVLQFIENKIKQYRRKSIDRVSRDEQIAKDKNLKEKVKKSPNFDKILKLKQSFKKEKKDQLISEKHLQFYLTLFQSFFAHFQAKQKEIYLPELKIWIQCLNTKSILDKMYECLQQNQSEKSGQLYFNLLLNVIKINFLYETQNNGNQIRIIIHLINAVLRRNQKQKQWIIPRCLLFVWVILKQKNYSEMVMNDLKKTLYYFLVDQEFESLFNFLFLQYIQSQEDKAMKKQIMQILVQIFIDQKFQQNSPFEAIKYFAFLNRYMKISKKTAFNELQDKLMKHMKPAYFIFQEKRQDIIKYCQKFIASIILFKEVLFTTQETKEKVCLVNILKRNVKTCECCTKIKQLKPIYYEALRAVANYHEQNPYIKSPLLPNFQHKYSYLDEIYYLELLIIEPQCQQNWLNLIRVNMQKIYVYYDSLVGKPLEQLQQKIKPTKKILFLAKQILPNCPKLTKICDYYIEILTILNIRERQYKMMLYDLEGAGKSTSKMAKESIKRYKEGLKRTLSELNSNPKDDVRIRALRVLQFKLKLAWVSVEKEYKQDEKKETVVIELEDYLSPYQKVFKPSKIKQQLNGIISDIKSIIKDLKKDEFSYEILQLEEDLIVEMYVFLFRNIEFKLQKIIDRLCEVIRVSSKTDQCRKLKEMQFTFNELQFTLNIMLNPTFLSEKQKYKFRHERLAISKTQINIYQIMFQNTFAPRPQPQRDLPKQSLQSYINNKYGIPKDRNFAIEIQQQEIDFSTIDRKVYSNKESNAKTKQDKKKKQNEDKSAWQHGFADRRIPGMNIKHSVFNPQHIDLGKYFYQRLKQYMLENESTASRFNAIHSVIGSYSFYNILQTLTKVMQQLHRVLANIIQGNQNQTKNPRTAVLALWACSTIVLRYAGNNEKAMEIFRGVFDMNSSEIVLTHLNQKNVAKPIFPIAQLYQRSIIQQITKSTYIEHVFHLLCKSNFKDQIVELLTKLLQISRGKISKGMPSDLVVATNIKIENGGEGKKNMKINLDLRFYFLMFTVGTQYYKRVMLKHINSKRMESKDQQFLQRIIKEIRSRIERDDTNFYVSQLEGFKKMYDKLYDRISKIKKEDKRQIIGKKVKKNESESDDSSSQCSVKIQTKDQLKKKGVKKKTNNRKRTQKKSERPKKEKNSSKISNKKKISKKNNLITNKREKSQSQSSQTSSDTQSHSSSDSYSETSKSEQSNIKVEG